MCVLNWKLKLIKSSLFNYSLFGFNCRPHVWGHFCLCYKHFKLMDDKSRIQHFGIRDGDQVFPSSLFCNQNELHPTSKSVEVIKIQ